VGYNLPLIGHNEFARILNQHVGVLARPAGIFQLLELFGLKGNHKICSLFHLLHAPRQNASESEDFVKDKANQSFTVDTLMSVRNQKDQLIRRMVCSPKTGPAKKGDCG
jgi:hypothetical protein